MSMFHLRTLALVLFHGVSLLLATRFPAVVVGLSSTMNQEPLEMTSNPDQWQIILSNDWDRIITRRLSVHSLFMPGSSTSYHQRFPLTLRTPVTTPYRHEQDRSWPSSFSESAEVRWTKVQSDQEGKLSVTFPDIRWSKLRATEGWAALQHHTVLHTSLSIQPPQDESTKKIQPRLVVQLTQGSFFTVLSRETQGVHIEWHAGNIYDMHRSTPNAVELPGIVHMDKPTTFDFFISGDYEIRLFGDPRDSGEEIPTLGITVSVNAEEKRKTIVRQESQDVVCDFVDGFAFGDALGVGLRSIDGWWTVEDIKLPEQFPINVSLNLLYKQLLAPSQTRIVPISINQTGKYDAETLSFILLISKRQEAQGNTPVVRSLSVPIAIALRHLPQWDPSNWDPIRATFFFASSHPTYFLVKPPIKSRSDVHSVPVLALHGAGVDVIAASFWADAIPRQEYSWIIMPTGRTEWGLDWHGPSASEAWATLPGLRSILHRRKEWAAWNFPSGSRALIVGHSNGGQGAWYLASRFPDRTQAVVPAAGYLSPAAYVPLTQSRGARFADLVLRSVLESSFMPDDNALFLGNLADGIPILAIHGGDDTNVPTWHSREYVSIIKSWGKSLNVSFHGDEHQPHWYPRVFQSEEVQSFIQAALDPNSQPRAPTKDVSEFVLTVADPLRSGSLHGWSIEALVVPGRLARLHVEHRDNETYVKTSNVRRLSVGPDLPWTIDSIILDGTRLPKATETTEKQTITLSNTGFCHLESFSTSSTSVPPGRLQNIFDTPGPITIIIPSDLRFHSSMLSAALRIAHTLDVFLKIDSEIVVDTVARGYFESGTENTSRTPYRLRGNIIVLGGKENLISRLFVQVPEADRRTEFGLSAGGEWLFRGRALRRFEDIGIFFTHPHPTDPRGAVVILATTSSNADSGSFDSFERILRLLVPRTGIAVPDWIILGKDTDNLGIGGVVGAGVWDSSWKWSDAMSYMA